MVLPPARSCGLPATAEERCRVIKSPTSLRDHLASGLVAQQIGRQFIITATGERIAKRAITQAVNKGWAEAFPCDLFGDELGAWRAPV
jgi:hypothetical protein